MQAALASLLEGPGQAGSAVQPGKLSRQVGTALHEALGIREPQLVQLLRVSYPPCPPCPQCMPLVLAHRCTGA